MAGEAPLAVLMLGRLGFQPWQYGLAFAVPCVGGLIGSRLARPLASRYGGYARSRSGILSRGARRVATAFWR
jgi:hypothetical protein